MRKQFNLAVKFIFVGIIIVIGLLFILSFTEYNTANDNERVLPAKQIHSVNVVSSNSNNGWGTSSFIK